MRLSLSFFLMLVAVSNAHFQLQFPPPRGPFDDDNEVKFCDGYNSVTNRSTFPLEGGILSLLSEHPHWTAGFIVSTADNSTSFNNFTQIVPYFQNETPGTFCYPLDFSKSVNGTTFKDQQNVTVQVVFDAGDGKLYQCADLTLSKDYKIPSNVTCSNVTATAAATSTSAHAPGATHTAGAVDMAFSMGFVTMMVGLSGLILVL